MRYSSGFCDSGSFFLEVVFGFVLVLLEIHSFFVLYLVSAYPGKALGGNLSKMPEALTSLGGFLMFAVIV